MSVFAAAMPVVGDLLNYFATEQTNENNAEIAYLNRKWQTNENKEQRDWEYNMWLTEQQYNTPAAQMQRYREAGINPFLMNNQGQVGSGETKAPSAPSLAGAPSMPTMIPARFDGLAQAGQLALQKEQVDANVANQQSEALSRYLDMALKFYQDGNKDAGDKLIDFAFAQYGNMHANRSLTKERMLNMVELQNLEKQSQQFELSLRTKYGERQSTILLDKMQAEYDKIVSERSLTEVMAKLREAEVSLAEAKTESERENAIRIQNEAKAALASAAAAYASAVASQANARSANAQAAISEDSKQYLINKLSNESAVSDFDYQTKQADFESEIIWRNAKRSEEGKMGSLLRNTIKSISSAVLGK